MLRMLEGREDTLICFSPHEGTFMTLACLTVCSSPFLPHFRGKVFGNVLLAHVNVD